MSPTARIRRISIVVPMLNEVAHVETLADDVASQDFDGEIELLVADGGSTDGSVERLVHAARLARLDLTVIENPARWVSHGLNACIGHATGDLVVRMDCHARYPRDYLRRCALAIEETGAWNVGGVVEATGRTPTERAVACAMDSPFGGIGWTRHGKPSGRVEVDTVTYGAFPRDVFDRIGLFDESLVRNQDTDLNVRIRRAGGTVLLDPAIRIRYVPRDSYRGVFRQYYEYGIWKMVVMRKHGRVTSVRGLASPALVASLAGLASTAFVSSSARWALAAELALYAVCAVGFGTLALRRHGEPLSLLPFVLAAFPTIHVAHGIGMLQGLLGCRRGQ